MEAVPGIRSSSGRVPSPPIRWLWQPSSRFSCHTRSWISWLGGSEWRDVRPQESGAPPEGVHEASLTRLGDGNSVGDQGAKPPIADGRSFEVTRSLRAANRTRSGPHAPEGADQWRVGRLEDAGGRPKARAEVPHNGRSRGQTMCRGTPSASLAERVAGNGLLQLHLDHHLAVLPRYSSGASSRSSPDACGRHPEQRRLALAQPGLSVVIQHLNEVSTHGVGGAGCEVRRPPHQRSAERSFSDAGPPQGSPPRGRGLLTYDRSGARSRELPPRSSPYGSAGFPSGARQRLKGPLRQSD